MEYILRIKNIRNFVYAKFKPLRLVRFFYNQYTLMVQACILLKNKLLSKTMANTVKPNTTDEYIALYPPEIQKRLVQIRETIRKAAPKAVEKISWAMPTYWQKENLIHFAAQKKHIGLYPGAEGVAAFADELKEYKTTKGAIQLPNNKDLPLDLIAKITGFKVKQAEKN
jgi:uncharacterized protein YdhG (YjbR/CyaY superfamily)